MCKNILLPAVAVKKSVLINGTGLKEANYHTPQLIVSYKCCGFDIYICKLSFIVVYHLRL